MHIICHVVRIYALVHAQYIYNNTYEYVCTFNIRDILFLSFEYGEGWVEDNEKVKVFWYFKARLTAHKMYNEIMCMKIISYDFGQDNEYKLYVILIFSFTFNEII